MISALMAIINIGTKNESVNVAQKVRLLNIGVLLTSFIVCVYSFSFIVFFKANDVAIYNLSFVPAYLTTFLFNHLRHHKLAKNWYFCLLMAHLFICVNVLLTKGLALHFFYFIVPTATLLIYDNKEHVIKVILNFSSAMLFLYCENTTNENPLLSLSPFSEHIYFQFAFLANMMSVILVLSYFVKQTEKNDALLVKQASTDPLTGLHNRRFFFEQGERKLRIANSLQLNSSLILIDLDFFKQINDQYGHAMGDQCLVSASDILMEIAPLDKLCSRIGGEEFAILLVDCDSYFAIKVAEKIRLNIKKLNIKAPQGHFVNMTASLGVSVNTEKNENLTALLEKADIELYKAKENGRDQLAITNTEFV